VETVRRILSICLFTLPHSCVSLLNYFAVVFGDMKIRPSLILIWNTIIWVLWRHRNKIIFENGIRDLMGVVDEIKVASWK
jgi:hypothetical protein